jgi:replication factor C large subunit
MPPARWQKMAGAKKQKAIRSALLNKIAGVMQVPQNTLREEYLGIISQLVEDDPVTFTRALSMDAESLNFFLHDKERSSEIVKKVALEIRELEKLKEKESKAKKAPPAEPPLPEEKPVETQKKPEKKPPSGHQVTLF